MRRIAIMLVTVLVLAYMISVVYYMVVVEPKMTPVLQETREAGYIYDLYVGGKPALEDRDYFGEPDAPITVLAYLEPGSGILEDFHNQTFRYLKRYIDSGDIRFYYKPLITAKSYREKDDKYQHAKLISCADNLSADDLFHMLSDYSKSLKGEYIIDQKCMESTASIELIEDISEVRAFGIASNPTLYVGLMGNDNNIFAGIPPVDWFEDTLRIHKIQLGE